MTLIDRLAEAAAGPDCWLRASPRGRAEYRRGVVRALRVFAGYCKASETVRDAVAAAIDEDERHG